MICLIFFVVLDGDGRITGNDATKFFAMSKLSRQELKQVLDFSLFMRFFFFLFCFKHFIPGSLVSVWIKI